MQVKAFNKEGFDLCEDEEFAFAYKPWPQIKKDMFGNEDFISEYHCIKSQQ